MAVTVLNREIYSLAEAARLLSVTPARLRGWVDGYTRGDVHYEPVIRPERTGTEIVTWGEFVEAGYLREYRIRGILQKMRVVVQRLRERFGVPYPLAHARPYLLDKEAVLEVQEELGLDSNLVMVRRVRDGQLVLAPKAQEFFEKVEFAPGAGISDDEAIRLYPDPTARQVVLDPLRGFGSPVVRNTRTANLYELWFAGETIAEIAEAYELADDDVEAAVRFESRLRNQESAA